MNGLQGRIPHALATAHGTLSATLDEGIKNYEANLRFGNADDVCRAVERFVGAFHQHRGGRDELRRRAMLVETRCGAGGEYEAARAAALQAYRVTPQRLSGSNLTIGGLAEATTTPRYLSEVTREREQIERALQDDALNATPGAREAYRSWVIACREVQREADALEVDGCWWLLHVHESGEHEPTETAEVARAITHSDIGGANLDTMKAAADSLANWAAESRADRFNGIGQTLEALAERLLNPGNSDAIAEADRGFYRPGGEPVEATSDTSTPTKPKRSTERGEGREQSAARGLLSIYTNGLSDDRFEQAAIVLLSVELTLDQKLWKIDAAMPIPSNVSAAKLGKALGKSKTAIQNTSWYIQNRKGERENEIGRRREKHRERGTQPESDFVSDDEE